MGVLYGVLAAVLIGTSDWFGGSGAKRASAITTVATALLSGTFMAIILVWAVPSEWIARDLLLGAGSGVTVGFALMFLFRGIAESSASVVSPIVSGFIAGCPVAWDLATGRSLSGLAATGIVVAVGGVALTTFSPNLGPHAKRGALFGVLSGACFGGAWILIGRTSIESGVWSAFTQRLVALAVMLAFASLRGVPRVLPRKLRWAGIMSGLFGVAGVAAYISGAQRGSLSAAAVATAMFPVTTVLLSFVVDGERLRRPQLIGIALALSGIGLLAAG